MTAMPEVRLPTQSRGALRLTVGTGTAPSVEADPNGGTLLLGGCDVSSNHDALRM